MMTSRNPGRSQFGMVALVNDATVQSQSGKVVELKSQVKA